MRIIFGPLSRIVFASNLIVKIGTRGDLSLEFAPKVSIE